MACTRVGTGVPKGRLVSKEFGIRCTACDVGGRRIPAGKLELRRDYGSYSLRTPA